MTHVSQDRQTVGSQGPVSDKRAHVPPTALSDGLMGRVNSEGCCAKQESCGVELRVERKAADICDVAASCHTLRVQVPSPKSARPPRSTPSLVSSWVRAAESGWLVKSRKTCWFQTLKSLHAF